MTQTRILKNQEACANTLSMECMDFYHWSDFLQCWSTLIIIQGTGGTEPTTQVEPSSTATMIQATTPALSSTTSLRCNCRWLNRPLMEKSHSQDTFLACSLEFPAWCHHDRQLHLHVHRQVVIIFIILKTIFIISISASLSQQATTVTWEPSVAGTQSQVMLRTRQN